MDKITLKLGTIFFIPGFLLLWTVFTPEFNTYDVNISGAWLVTTEFRTIISVIFILFSIISFWMLCTKKYVTENSLQDAKDKRGKKALEKTITKFITDNGLSERFTENNIIGWVEQNYEEFNKNIHGQI